jgi:enediyne biosynthesis protein E4
MPITRRQLLLAAPSILAAQTQALGFRFVDVTSQAGIRFTHNNGAFGQKLLPETLGPGCAFLDYDNDGWQDILLINGMDWPGHKRARTTLKLYRNNRDGTFTDVTRAAGLDVEMYGMGVAVGDFDNDGFPDLFVSCVGQSRLFRNTGKGSFVDVTKQSGLAGREGLSTSALWFDYDGDGLLDLFVCNYVRWSPETDVHCSLDGKVKSYCTPEAYRGTTCWLFRNRGDGSFEDVTAKAGVFDSSSKSLGVAMLDFDRDSKVDLFVANDTQPNKLYRNLGNGKFDEIGVQAGVAFSDDGKARAGMGVDAADYDHSGFPSVAVTNFTNEMLGLFRNQGDGTFVDVAPASELGRITRGSLGFGCLFFDSNLNGSLDLVMVNGHIDEAAASVRGDTSFEQPPHLLLNNGNGRFRDVAREAGGGFAAPKLGRGVALGDFDNDGDLDVLISVNHGPVRLYRNDVSNANRGVRFRLVGTKSNRDAIGAVVEIETAGAKQWRMVKSGSSYLSQSEFPLTFGLGKEDTIRRAVVRWPSGRQEEFSNLAAGVRYECVEGKGITAKEPFRK